MGMQVYSEKRKQMLELRGEPDGPQEWHPELGQKVGTYLTPGFAGRAKVPTIQHHVPIEYRGPWKPDESLIPMPEDYRTNDLGQVLCVKGYWEMSNRAHRKRLDRGTGLAQSPCGRFAANRTFFCTTHGGALHPLDKLVEERPATRYDKFRKGILTIEDLDNEELAFQQIKNGDGSFPTRRKPIPRDTMIAMSEELMRRHKSQIAAATSGAINTMIEISKSNAYEGADRVNASKWIAERQLGKEPDKVIIEQSKPWEVAFAGIAGGPREDALALDNIVEAEVVETGPDAETGPESIAYVPEGWEDNDIEPELDDMVDSDPELDSDHSVADVDEQETVDAYDVVAEQQRKAQEAAELKERLKVAKARRIAARSKGLDTVDDRPFKAKGRLDTDPENPGGKHFIFVLEDK